MLCVFSKIGPKLKGKKYRNLYHCSQLSSNQIQYLIVINLQNQSMTDRQTAKQTGRLHHNPAVHAHQVKNKQTINSRDYNE